MHFMLSFLFNDCIVVWGQRFLPITIKGESRNLISLLSIVTKQNQYFRLGLTWGLELFPSTAFSKTGIRAIFLSNKTIRRVLREKPLNLNGDGFLPRKAHLWLPYNLFRWTSNLCDSSTSWNTFTYLNQIHHSELSQIMLGWLIRYRVVPFVRLD